MNSRKFLELLEKETNQLLLKQLEDNKKACMKIIENMMNEIGLNSTPQIIEQFVLIQKLELLKNDFKKSIE